MPSQFDVRKLRWSADSSTPVLAATYLATLIDEDAYGLWLAAPADGLFHHPDGGTETMPGASLQLFPPDQWWTAWWWTGRDDRVASVDICRPVTRGAAELEWVDMQLELVLDVDDEVRSDGAALSRVTQNPVIPVADVNAAINANIAALKRLRMGDPLFTVIGPRKLANL